MNPKSVGIPIFSISVSIILVELSQEHLLLSAIDETAEAFEHAFF